MPYRPATTYSNDYSVIHPWTDDAIGAQLRGWALGTLASAAYPLANLAYFVPFQVAAPTTVVGVFWYNGTVTGGNCDVGIYDANLSRIVSLGTTGRGAASSIVVTNTLTDTTIYPGNIYYMGFAHDGVNNFFRSAPAVPLLAACGVLEATTAFPLPATPTVAWCTRAVIPMFGLCTNTTGPSL